MVWSCDFDATKKIGILLMFRMRNASAAPRNDRLKSQFPHDSLDALSVDYQPMPAQDLVDHLTAAIEGKVGKDAIHYPHKFEIPVHKNGFSIRASVLRIVIR